TNNFWHELIAGIEGFNRRERLPQGLAPVTLAFFKYHFEIESGHGANVWHELEETCKEPGFAPGGVLAGGRGAFDAVAHFLLGLERSRKELEERTRAPRRLRAPSLRVRSAPVHAAPAAWAGHSWAW